MTPAKQENSSPSSPSLKHGGGRSPTKASKVRAGHTGRYVIRRQTESRRNDDDDDDSVVDEDEESEDDYCKGGYHPVRLDEEFKSGQYVIKSKLGWGHFSTVWMTHDKRNQRQVAMKIVKSARHYTEAALDEIKILNRINAGSDTEPGKSRLVKLHDSFIHEGIHGRHVCMVFEVLGENLLTVIRRYKHRGLPIPVVKRIALQTLHALDYMHRVCGIIHTDLKPENILCIPKGSDLSVSTSNELNVPDPSALERNLSNISLTAAETRSGDSPSRGLKRPNSSSESLTGSSASQHSCNEDHDPIPSKYKKYAFIETKLVDVGNACWIDKHFTDDIQTRQYRSPEVILKARYDETADIWSCACLIFELLTGDYLFEPHSGEHFEKDDDHLAQMWELTGDFPRDFALSGRDSHRYFDRHGRLKRIHKLSFWPLKDVLYEKYGYSKRESEEISSFLSPMLSIVGRSTAATMLKHDWLKR